MPSIHLFFKQYWKVITWCVVIFVFSSLPTLPEVGFIWWDFVLKKSAHVLEYTVLFLLTYKAVGQPGNWRTALLFSLAYALSDEYHQSFVAGRTAKLTDIGFDALGMYLGYLRLKNKTQNLYPERSRRAKP